MSSMNIEKFTKDAYEKECVNLEASSFAEVARVLLVRFGTLLLLSADTYFAVATLSAVLAALLF